MDLDKIQTFITQFLKCPGYNPKSFNMQRTKQKQKINSHKKGGRNKDIPR